MQEVIHRLRHPMLQSFLDRLQLRLAPRLMRALGR
jgi:hypothetical protein